MNKESLLKTLDGVRQAIDTENEYTIELKSTKKRSLNANAYMWALCDKIAKVIKSTREDVYRAAVKAVGVYDDLAVQTAAAERLVAGWNEKGIGWFAESFGGSKIKGADKVRVFYGSSIYSTAEMARLIDHIIDEAKNLDIETLTPAEIEKLKSGWRSDL